MMERTPSRRHLEPDDLPEGDLAGHALRRAAARAARARGRREGDLHRARRPRRRRRLRPDAQRLGRRRGPARLRLDGGRPDARLRHRRDARRGAGACTRSIDKPNLYVKIPATEPGLPAIEEMIAAGKSINVTLIFSLERHREVMEAYIRGIERLVEDGGDPRPVSLGRELLRLARRHRGGQAARRDRRPRRAEGQARRREREARVPELEGGLLRRALGGARGEGRVEAVVPLGVDVDEEPGVPRRALRRGADRAGDVNTMPEETIAGLPGSRRGRADARAGRRRGAAGSSTQLAEARASTTTTSRDTLEREGVQKFSDSFAELLDGIRAEARRARQRLISTRRSSSSGSGSATRPSGRGTTRRTGSAGSTSRCACASGSASSRELAQASRGEVDDVVLLGMGGSSLAPRGARGARSARPLPRARHDASGGDPPARRRARPRADALRRLVEVGHDARDALRTSTSSGSAAGKRASRFVVDHRPRLAARAARARARHRGLRRRADDRRALLGAVGRSGSSRPR